MEFVGKEMKAFLDKEKIYFHPKVGKLKASIAENAIYRVKKVLYTQLRSTLSRDWVSILQSVTERINNSPSSSIYNLKPNDFNSPMDDYKLLRMRQKEITENKWKGQTKQENRYSSKTTSFQPGDTVYLNNIDHVFDKSYETRVSKKKVVKKIPFKKKTPLSLHKKQNFVHNFTLCNRNSARSKLFLLLLCTFCFYCVVCAFYIQKLSAFFSFCSLFVLAFFHNCAFLLQNFVSIYIFFREEESL